MTKDPRCIILEFEIVFGSGRKFVSLTAMLSLLLKIEVLVKSKLLAELEVLIG